MKTAEHLRDLFEYDDWANRRTIAALENNPSDRSRRVLAHILITKQEYFERLAGKDSTGFDFWLDLTIEGCAWLARSTKLNYSSLLEGARESVLEETARYKTSEGVEHENTYRELLTHVLMHSAVHAAT